MNLAFQNPLTVLVYVLMLLAYGSNLNSAIVGACTATVAAVLWYYMPDTGNTSANRYTMTDQITRNMIFLPYLMASAFFTNTAGGMTANSSINQSFMMVMTSMAAITAGLVFWGYGFDLCREQAMRAWYLTSVVAALGAALNSSGYLLSLTTLTVCMCNMVGNGGLLYFMAWMTFHNDNSPMSTAAAFFTLTGAAYVFMSFFMSFFTNSILPVVLLVVCLLATMLLSQQGLPVGRGAGKEYNPTQYAGLELSE